MQQNVVITLVGKDRPGIVKQISQCVFAHQGNWLASSLSKMAGQFAGIIQVQLPGDQVEDFNRQIGQMADLRCIVNHEDSEGPDTEQRLVQISIVGNDKAGIVQEITSALQHVGANVIKMNSLCESAPNWGSELFKADIQVALPEGVELDDVSEQLEKIANDLIVDMTIDRQ